MTKAIPAWVIALLIAAGAAPEIAWSRIPAPIFEQALSRYVLGRTIEGAELTSRLLGRRVVECTNRDYSELLEVLSRPGNERTADEIARRLSNIKERFESFRPGRVQSRARFLQRITSESLSIDKSLTGQIRFVNSIPFRSSRSEFLQLAAAGEVDRATARILRRYAQLASKEMTEVELYAKTFVEDTALVAPLENLLVGRFAVLELESSGTLRGIILETPIYGSRSSWVIRTMGGEIETINQSINRLTVSKLRSPLSGSEFAGWEPVGLYAGLFPDTRDVAQRIRSAAGRIRAVFLTGGSTQNLNVTRGIVLDAPAYGTSKSHWTVLNEATGEVNTIHGGILELRISSQ